MSLFLGGLGLGSLGYKLFDTLSFALDFSFLSFTLFDGIVLTGHIFLSLPLGILEAIGTSKQVEKEYIMRKGARIYLGANRSCSCFNRSRSAGKTAPEPINNLIISMP